MLLAQIKSNYSSGAESSSDDEEAETDKKSSSKVKKEDKNEEKDEGTMHAATCCQLVCFYCVSSHILCLSSGR